MHPDRIMRLERREYVSYELKINFFSLLFIVAKVCIWFATVGQGLTDKW